MRIVSPQAQLQGVVRVLSSSITTYLTRSDGSGSRCCGTEEPYKQDRQRKVLRLHPTKSFLFSSSLAVGLKRLQGKKENNSEDFNNRRVRNNSF